tara:strand:+ start:230 stop:1216 length:987 start_codon:yes stop_codon:yes gene_type:complete
MASISKHGGSWQARVRIKGYRQQTRTFDRKVDAQKWANETEAQMRNRRYVDTSAHAGKTLEDLLVLYDDRHASGREGHQHSGLVKMWRNHPIAKRGLDTLTAKDFVDIREARLKKVTPKTVREDLLMFRQAFDLARKEWGFEGLQNPLADMRIPSQSKGRDRRLKPGEEKRLIAGVGPRSILAAAIRLALETAMRRGELVKLDWRHVDLDRCVAHLPQTKNGDTRDVPLSDKAVEVFRELGPRDLGPVLGVPGNELGKEFREVRDRLGIEGLTFHDLRHEATSRLYELGTLSDMEVAHVTGHKTLQMLKRYTHLKAENIALKLRREAG